MKRFAPIALVAVLCWPLWLCGQAPQAGQTPPDWENARVFALGKEPAHATFVPYPDERAALRADSQASTYGRALVGQEPLSGVHRLLRAGQLYPL
jgi:hypothetical protein